MKIKYVVCELHIVCGQLEALSDFDFDNVEDAIEFKKTKINSDTWWDIFVDYEE